MTLSIIDIETTGLNPQVHEIIEIGCVIVDNDGDIVEAFDMKVRPDHIGTAEEGAFIVNGYSEADWESAVSLKEAMESLSKSCTDTYFMAYNATFDWSFIQKAFHDTGVADPFPYHRLDLMSMVTSYPNYPRSFAVACGENGLLMEPFPHRALTGAVCAYQLYKKLVA